MKLRNLTFAAATVALTFASTAAPASAQTPGISPVSQQLSGSWFGELNIPNIPQLRVFMIYSPDGTITATSSNNPAVESHQYGAWVRVGDRLFSLTVLGFNYDAKGNYIGYRKIRATISLTPDLSEFQGDGEADILDPAGNVLFSVPTLTVHGKRIVVEPAASQANNPGLKPREKQDRQ